MAKKQTRRSISVSRTTYERLKAFCETNNISMSQLVETRVNDFLGPNDIVAGGMAPSAAVVAPRPFAPRPMSAMPGAMPARPMEARPASHAAPVPAVNGSSAASANHPAGHHPGHHAGHHPGQQASAPAAPSVPMTSAAARFAVEPPPPIIKPKQETAAPKPAEKTANQIFTF